MSYFVLAFIAGALTLIAPCILPVVPFLLARADGPFVKHGLPMLVGMALTFAAVATLGAVAGSWAVHLNEVGRFIALAALAATGAMLVAPGWGERAMRPLVALGSRLADAGTRPSNRARTPVLASFGLGVATGLLWAPCAGPVLGLILTAAALQGPSVRTSLLLLAYAAGAATSLAVLLGAGQRVFALLRRSLGLGVWLRRGLGVAVLAGVAAVALGADAGLSQPGTDRIERRLLDRLRPPQALSVAPVGSGFVRVQARAVPAPLALPAEGALPPLDGAVEWLNSPPLTAEGLRGKVVLIDFWTFGCSNCRNALPHVVEWQRKYKDQGLVVIGIHSPEFAYEKNLANVKRALGELNIVFPVAVDNDFAVWRAFHNQYWPAHYFVDARGRIRFHHFGEGEYEKSEQVIRQLLDEAARGV